MNGVSIEYGDVAPGAKENFRISASEHKYETLANLQKYNMQLYNYANPCELYQTPLDGKATVFPSPSSSAASIGLWSEQLSKDDGTFESPIALVLESEGLYSSQGFTFTFDNFNNIYPTRITIQWFRVTSEGIEDLSGEIEFMPTSATYFCQKQVDNYNKVVIKFYSINMPQNRLKLEVIDYGYGTIFNGDELMSVKMSQAVDPITTELKINTCDFILSSKSDMIYSFQKRQLLKVRFNDDLIETVLVKNSNRTAKKRWNVSAENYISVLETTTYVGGIYEDVSAGKLIDDIFRVANVPYKIDDSLKDVKMRGYLPYSNCRQALQQVCFALQAMVSTAGLTYVNISKTSNDITQKITLSRIKEGQCFDTTDDVTSVAITVTTYEKKDKIDDNRVAVYNSSKEGSGNNILVKFDEPLYDLYCGGRGEIVESGSNYAIINATDDTFRLVGYGYAKKTYEKTRNNSVVGALSLENKVSITDASLISPNNVDDVLESVFNYLTKTTTINSSIYDRKHVKYGQLIKYGEVKYGEVKYGSKHPNIIEIDKTTRVGDKVCVETEYNGDMNAIIISQTFNLNGNILLKESVLKNDDN